MNEKRSVPMAEPVQLTELVAKLGSPSMTTKPSSGPGSGPSGSVSGPQASVERTRTTAHPEAAAVRRRRGSGVTVGLRHRVHEDIAVDGNHEMLAAPVPAHRGELAARGEREQ